MNPKRVRALIKATAPAAVLLVGCAQLHHAQLGDIDNRPHAVEATPIDIKVSETGVSTYEAGAVAKGLARNTAQRGAASNAQLILEVFQMGPRTGNPVFDATYAENLAELIHAQCPAGDVSDLLAVREARKYPVVSGEIVKITGVCHVAAKPRTQS